MNLKTAWHHARCLSGEVGFLPDLAFPFVKLFGPKAESAFEAVATLLLNWCKGWFELFPNPPLPLLRRFLVGEACASRQPWNLPVQAHLDPFTQCHAWHSAELAAGKVN